MMRKILTMCSVLLLVPLAADAVEVKLINTGRMTWNIFDYGYWIEYEIDGKRFRSDTDAGQRTNQLAWELMSEEDKLKVIKAYGMGGSKARIEQFGTDGAQKIADKVNDDTGWTEAWNAFADRLSKRDFPTLEAIFRNEETRSAYFSDNYAEEWATDSVPEYTHEMHQLQEEQTLVWGWACTTYEAIKTANEKRIQTAVQALSGDLIALICDKVLVPNITFENPIELGFKYGFRKEVLGSLLDYVNSISETGDKLVESVLGERASGESGAEIIAKLTDMVNMDLHFISQCRQRLSQNKAEIERLGAAALEKKRAANAAHSTALAAFAEERKKGEPTGMPADAGICQANAEYQSQIDVLVKQLEKTTDEKKKKDLETEIAQVDADKTSYNQQLLANLDAAFLKWYNACLAEYTSWTNSDPRLLKGERLSQSAVDLLWGNLSYDVSEGEASAALSEARAHVGVMKQAKGALEMWMETGNELVETYRSSYDALLSDLRAVDPAGCHVTEVGQDLAGSLLKRFSGIGGVASVEQDSYQELIDLYESWAELYAENYGLKKECEAKFAAARAEILASVQLAVVEYANANGVLTNQLANPPAFLAGLSTTYGILNPIPQSSKLWQDIYGGNPNGNAAKMRQYCRELNDYYIQYLSNRQKVDDAYNNVLSYVSACRSHGISMFNEAGWVDLRIMPPACYETLDLVKALIRDFNVQDREGKLLEYYVILANNEDYYAEKRDQLVRAAKSPALMSASVSAEELPTYAQICNSISSLQNNPTGFADGIKGYSPDESGGVFDRLITPIQAAIEGRRNALSWYYSIEGGQARVFGFEGAASGAVVIPGEFEGCPVTELGDYLFSGSSMTSVVIPDSVVTIGSCAFSGCRQLGMVRIPVKVASIGEWAFAGCDALMKFEVAAGNAAYRAVNGLLFAKGGTDPIAGIGGDVTVPPGVKRIGTQLFYERALGSVTLPPGVVEIGEESFAYSTLREITIPASVTTIAGDAFYRCDQLVTVYVDKGDNDRVRELLRDAGASLSRITIVSEFTETVDGIEWSYATANGEAVVTWLPEKPEGESYGKVEVPSTLGGLAVTGIGNSVFMWRSDITEVVIPQGVRSIGEFAFNSSPSIKTVTLPKSVTRIDNLAFAYSSLTTVRTAPGDAARIKTLMTKGGLSVSVNWVESDDPAERPEIIDTPTDGAVPQGRYEVLDLEKVLGLEVPSDVDYAAGDKVTVKVEGLAKGLKLVTTPVYEDPNAKKKVIANYVYTIEGVPTETVDFDTQTMYARVTVTYKDKTKTANGTGKAESLQPIPLSIVPAKVRTLAAGVLNEVYEPADIAELWPEVADAKVNPTEWSFKGWPTGIKYNNKATDVNWSYKSSDGKSYGAIAVPYTVYGQPTKAGEFPITATHKYKIDGKSVSETFSAILTVWGDDGATDFRYEDQAYVATKTKTLDETWKSFSGLPAGIKYTTKLVAADTKKGTPEYPAYSLYGTPTKAGVFAVTATKVDPNDSKKTVKETFLWKVTEGENPGLDATQIGWGEALVKYDGAETRTMTLLQGLAADFAVDASALAAGAKVTVSGLPSGLKYDAKMGKITGVATKAEKKVVTVKVVQNGVTVTKAFAIDVAANPFAGAYHGAFQHHVATAVITPAAGGTAKLVLDEYVPSKQKAVKYTATAKGFSMAEEYDPEDPVRVVYEFALKADAKNNPDFAAAERVLEVKLEGKALGQGVMLGYGSVSLRAKDDPSSESGFSGQVYKALTAADYATFVKAGMRPPPVMAGIARDKAGRHLFTGSAVLDEKKLRYQVAGRLRDGTAVKALQPLCWFEYYLGAPSLFVEKGGDKRANVALFAGSGKLNDDIGIYEYESVVQFRSAEGDSEGEFNPFDAVSIHGTAAEEMGLLDQLLVLDKDELAAAGFEGEAPVFRFRVEADFDLSKAKINIYAPDAKGGDLPLKTLSPVKLTASSGYVFKGSFKWDAKVGGDGNTYSFELVPGLGFDESFLGRCEVKPAKGVSIVVTARLVPEIE